MACSAISLALFGVSLFCSFSLSKCQLQPYGKNVQTKYEYYYATQLTSTKTQKSTRTCSQTCALRIIWCVNWDTVCRTLYYYQWTSKYKKVIRTRAVYVCKTGWAPSGIGCTKPICSSGCKNGGSCVAPNTCQCRAGWTGYRCSTDVNECRTSSKNRCGYKPGCINTQGSYRCSCSSGYYLSANGRSCYDVNECTSSKNKCGYKPGCINTQGSYRCSCSSGFYLGGNGRSCYDIDECSPSSGINHGCQMKCNNNIGSYTCSCDKGYYLTSNGRDCSDHNECEGNKHGCEQVCLNLPGGYNCTCFAGYRRNDKDLKKCDDLNECFENISGCAHNCKNTIGGFNCSCNRGYLLGKDSLSCIDIDECSKPVNYCQHKCINSPGSYICACRQGFYLNYDGKTCTGQPCFPIYKPINGNKNCSGYATEDSCDFYCLPGYELTGSKRRTCGPDKEWTGNNTKCEIIHCKTPNEPSNGFVYSPCSTHYGSQCSYGCDSGYFAESTTLTCDENGFWKPNNASCNEIKVCEPNPCFHGGICSVVSQDQYRCDCSNTGYKGTNCDVGYFNISNYPTVITNEISPPIMISCSPPTNQITLHINSRDLKFAPSTLVFNRDNSLDQSIQVTARQTGYHFISYSISGPSAHEFNLPEEDVLFVKSHKNSPDDLSNDGLTLSFPYGCHKKQVGVCSGLNLTPIVASSTSPFVSFGPLTATEGLVALEVGNITKVPLSLRGINLQHTSEGTLPDSCNDNDVVSYSTESLIKSRALVKAFTEIIDNSLPTWINVTLSENKIVQKTQSSDLMTYYLTGIQLQKSGVGDGLPLDDDMIYSLLATKYLNLTIRNDVDIFRSNQLSLAVELCRESPPNIVLQQNFQEHKALIKDIQILKNLREYGWNFKFDSFHFSKANTIKVVEKGWFWDGQSFINLGASPGANFAAVLSLKKHLNNLTFADITMEFDGTLVGNVKDINKIVDSPLHEPWNVDLNGKIAFTIVFKMEGKTVKLFLNGPESIAYANFGGNLHKELYKKRTGFFFTTILDKDPFLNTTLKNFVDMKTDANFSCFLDTRLFKEKNRFHHSEKTDSLSCAFHGTLKVGLLRFNTAQLNLQMGKQINSNIAFQNSVQLTGALGKSEDLTFGIFQLDLSRCMNARFLFSKDKPGFSGSFCGICNMFGMKKLVNVSISHEDIKFQTRGKMYNRFDASMNCSSPILPWENQVYEVDGKFESNTVETDFVSTLKQGLESYAKNSISQAMKRKEAIEQTVERARIRLEKLLSLKEVALNKLQRLTNDHAFAKKQFEIAKKTLKSLEIDAKNYSKDIDKLKLDLNSLCNTKQCNQVCQEGVYCTTCYEYITEKSKGMCPATCFRTEQRLIPPYSEVVLCDRQSCKRIHSTNGLFKSIFGGLVGGIVKSVFSFTITVVATALGAPPPVAGALGSGITTLLDTGRVDEVFCSVSKGFLVGSIGGKSPISIYKEAAKKSKKLALKETGIALGRKGASSLVSKAISCQREQHDGRWDCKVVQVKCSKGRYEYEYEHYPYECKKSCVVETIARTIEKSCCKSVTCASFIANITCVLENAVCKKARIDALERISKTKSDAGKLLKDLEYAKSNVSFWNVKMQKSYNRVLRQQRWVNMTVKSADSLDKAYNGTIESRQQLDKLLSKPLKLMSLFNEQLTSAHGIKMKDIRFTTKVFPGNDNKLLPIDITFEANGTLRLLSTVFDFAKINTSLKSISEEIMLDITTNVFSSSRKKRSVNIPVAKPDTLLVSLKKYHTYCAKFTNYHDVLYDVAQSLYNLSYEHLLLQEALSQSDQMAFNVTSLNQTIEGNYSLADYINDLELSETLELRQEQRQQNYESVNSTSKLLIYNWFATVEDMFNSSRMNYECSGMSDCIKHILDSLLQMFSVIEADGVDHIREQVKDLGIQLEYLSNSTNTTIEEGLKISSEILSILEKMKEGEVVCAQSPNITKQPEPVTEIGTGKVLVLNCNASGTALLYSWTFNGKALQNQKSNVLKISNTTVFNSGNYTCIVSNHIAREKSITAVVIIHPPPIIIEQPIEYLAAVLAEDDSLQCQVEETSNNVSYQWWFKRENPPSSFAPLPNETFPYISFSPMKAKDEGWYFCQVSNPYGETTSRISFVKALSFTLPVPTAVLSFSLDRETERVNSSVQPSNFTGYEVLSSYIMKHILSENSSSDAVQVENLRPINCLFGKTKNESNGDVGICSWEFQYIGRNVTSNVTIDNDFEVNAGMVVNATQELSFTIERLVNATNNSSLSFSVAGNIYFARANSIAIHKYSLVCPKTQVLLQKDFKCVDCPPGYHATVSKNKIMTCTPCPLGFYQTEAGKTSCNPCPKGFTTWNIGTYKRGECKVICATGHYGRVINGTGYCVLCPLNKFQPEEGQFECLACPSNHVTKIEGATDSTHCISVAKTDQPNSTTETKPTRITDRTEEKSTGGTLEKTTTVPHEGEKNESEKTIEPWKIGLSGGAFLLLILSGIVVLIYIIRRKRNGKGHSARGNQTERESSSRNDNSDASVIYSFENAVYEEPPLDIKTAEIEHVYETPQWGYFDASTSDASKGDTGKIAYTNKLFHEMSGQKNFNLYS